jgi:hypothetical protein
MPFMIRNKYGDFSRGGGNPDFVPFEKAKTWKNLGQVKNHLSMFRTFDGKNQVPDDWEVVEVAMAIVGQPENARKMAQPYCDKQAEANMNYRDRYQKEQAERERAELKRLMKKYQVDKPGHAPGFE